MVVLWLLNINMVFIRAFHRHVAGHHSDTFMRDLSPFHIKSVWLWCTLLLPAFVCVCILSPDSSSPSSPQACSSHLIHHLWEYHCTRLPCKRHSSFSTLHLSYSADRNAFICSTNPIMDSLSQAPLRFCTPLFLSARDQTWWGNPVTTMVRFTTTEALGEN